MRWDAQSIESTTAAEECGSKESTTEVSSSNEESGPKGFSSKGLGTESEQSGSEKSTTEVPSSEEESGANGFKRQGLRH